MILRGRNLDTGGDSGAGKTNVLLAIQFLFGECRLPSKALQCWYDSDPFYVQAYLEDDVDGVHLVKRNAKGLVIDKLKGKAADQKLDQICGVPAGLREALTYRDQLKPMRFLAMRDKEMKEFLFQVLGLGNVEDEIAQRTKNLHRLEMAATSAVNTLDIWSSSVSAQLKEPVEPEQELTIDAQADVSYAEIDVAKAQRDVNACEDELCHIPEPDDTQVEALRKAVKEADAVVTIITASERARVQAWEERKNDILRDIRRLEEGARRAARLRTENARLNVTAESLRANLCAMCGRPWEEAAAQLKELEQLVQRNEVQIALNEKDAADIPALEALLTAHVFDPDPRAEQIKAVREGLVVKLAKASQDLQNASQLARADATTRLANARQKLSEAQRRWDQAEHRLEALRNTNRQRLEAYAIALNEYEAAGKMRAFYQKAVDETRVEFERESDYLELLKGFRNRIFDEVLVSIGAEASNIIANLPNAQHITIEFKSERVTDKGTVQERITPVVLLHGIERTLEEAVSGGQLTSLSLAVDLAVVRVISQRLGCNLNWIILDEAFNGHDQVTKAGCLEMLSTYAHDKLVLIVDHSSEFKEMFSKIVTVEHHNKLSSVCL